MAIASILLRGVAKTLQAGSMGAIRARVAGRGAARFGGEITRETANKAGRGGYRAGGLIARGGYAASEAVSKTAFTAAFAAPALVAAGVLKAGASVGRGTLKFGWSQAKGVGLSRAGAVKGLVQGLGHDNPAIRMARIGQAMTGVTLPFTLGAAVGVNKLGSMNVVRDPRDRDPANAVHLTQSLYNTLR